MNIDIEQLRKMRADGVPNADIMVYFGVSKSALEKTVKAHKLPPKPYRWPVLDMDRFRAEWMAGTTIKAIAEVFAISTERVAKEAKIAGLPPRGHGGRREPTAPVKMKAPSAPTRTHVRAQIHAVPYAEVNALADANGWTIQRAQQEIHRQRAGQA